MESSGGEKTMKAITQDPATESDPPVCLSIAGLDPSGGAGILADVRAFAAFGCFPSAAVTAITFQNTVGVFGAEAVSADSVSGQVLPVFEDYQVSAVKTGMLPNKEIIEAVADILAAREYAPLVVDPVVRSTSGFDLIDDSALRALIDSLFSLAVVVTPNLAEAERISGMSINSEKSVHEAAEVMLSLGAKAVLIKGGHVEFLETPDQGHRVARDFLFSDGEVEVFEEPFIETMSTHGTGCVLSSSIAACLAKGFSLKESVGKAKRFVNKAIRTAPEIGKGHSPINLDPSFTLESE